MRVERTADEERQQRVDCVARAEFATLAVAKGVQRALFFFLHKARVSARVSYRGV